LLRNSREIGVFTDVDRAAYAFAEEEGELRAHERHMTFL
jgi:hypothetical protein